MESNKHHPLECITNCQSLQMLESCIPFVEYPLKLPLALFIKFSEIQLIIRAFSSIENLTKLGLHTEHHSPTDMLCSLTGISPEMLNMLFSLSGTGTGSMPADWLAGLSSQGGMDFSKLSSLFQTDYSKTEPLRASHAEDSSYNFDEAIAKILADYDLNQAADYASSEPVEQELPSSISLTDTAKDNWQENARVNQNIHTEVTK